MRRIFIVLWAVVFTSVLSLPAYAARDLITQPGIIDRNVTQPPVVIPEPALQNEPSFAPPPQKKQLEDADDIVGHVRRIEFEGNSVVPTLALKDIARPYTATPLTKDRLAELKYRLTKYYYDRGYIFVKVITPPQDISDHVLTIKVVESKLHRVRLRNAGALNPGIADKLTERLSPNEVLNEEDLESAISDLRDLNNIMARMNISKGEAFGTSNIDIILQEYDETRNTIGADNYGSELTGHLVSALHLEKKNLLGLGESYGFDFRRSSGDLWSLGLTNTTPIGISNILLDTRATYSENQIGRTLRNLGLSGETAILHAALSKKLVNTRSTQKQLKAGIEVRRHTSLTNKVVETEDHIRQAFIEGSYLKIGSKTTLFTSLKFTQGLNGLGASEKGSVRATRVQADPAGHKVNPFVMLSYQVNDTDQLRLISRAQAASNILLSSDLFSIGGFGSVRGFPVGKESGESGFLANLEYNRTVNMNSPKWRTTVGGFFDMGAAYNRIEGSITDSHLYSVGLKLSATYAHTPTTPLTVNLEWGHPVGNYKATDVANDTLYVSVNRSF